MPHLASSRRRRRRNNRGDRVWLVLSLYLKGLPLRDLHAARSINELSGIAKSKSRDVGAAHTHTCNMIIPSNIEAKCQERHFHRVQSLVTRHVSEHRRCERNLLALLSCCTVFEQNHCCRTRGDVILRVPPGMGKHSFDLLLFFPVKIDLHADLIRTCCSLKSAAMARYFILFYFFFFSS